MEFVAFVIALALLSAGCATKPVSWTPELPPPVPKVSVGMPRPPLEILSDAQDTLNDLRARQQAAQQLLTP